MKRGGRKSHDFRYFTIDACVPLALPVRAQDRFPIQALAKPVAHARTFAERRQTQAIAGALDQKRAEENHPVEVRPMSGRQDNRSGKWPSRFDGGHVGLMSDEIITDEPAFLFEGDKGSGNTSPAAAGDKAKIGYRYRRCDRRLGGAFAVLLRLAAAGFLRLSCICRTRKSAEPPLHMRSRVAENPTRR
jgi:hypothetical protein